MTIRPALRELHRLQTAIARLKVLRGRTPNVADKKAIDVAIEHIDARVIDIKGSADSPDWRND